MDQTRRKGWAVSSVRSSDGHAGAQAGASRVCSTGSTALIRSTNFPARFACFCALTLVLRCFVLWCIDWGARSNKVVFGGFQDNNRATPKYFNDTYVFDLETYRWSRLQFASFAVLPAPRSAAQLCASPDGIVVHGGYSIARVKGDVFRGNAHDDSWILKSEPAPPAGAKSSPTSAVAAGLVWTWHRIKHHGESPVSATGA